MAGKRKSRADIEHEYAALWARLSGVNAKLEEPVSERERLREAVGMTEDEFLALGRDPRGVMEGLTWPVGAYGRLHAKADAVRVGLRRECDHAFYGGSAAEVDDLAEELNAATVALGGTLSVNHEGEVHHGQAYLRPA